MKSVERFTVIEKKIFENTDKGLIVRIKIIPNSSRNEIFFDGDILKVKVTAQPVENKANKALIEFLSKKLKIAKSNIQIIKGELNKEKTLLISKFSEEEFRNYIEI